MERKGNVLFNDAFNIFYLQLYVKDHSAREEICWTTTWATLSD